MKALIRASNTILLAGLLAVWWPPLHRTAKALERASAYHAETQSIDAANDVDWNACIGAGYVLLLAIGILTIVFLKSSLGVRYVPIVLGFAAAAFYNAFPFDTMIVIAPIRDPRIPLAVAFFSALWLIAGLAYQLNQRFTPDASRITPHASR
jgi:hypothetical protein